MIGQVLPRGRSVRGLLYYLFTEGLAGEKGLEAAHADPRVIAGWDPAEDLQRLQPPVCGGRRDFKVLASRLNEPVLALGLDAAQLRRYKPVYHLTIAAAKDRSTGRLLDRYLTDEQWADIAREYLHRIGLAPRGDDTAVRWVAVRHADDHVHVVATLARQDGRRPRLSNDRYRSMEASRFVEATYGLTSMSATAGAGAAPVSRAEQRKHQDAMRRDARGPRGRPAPDRDMLRRQVRVAAAGASGLEQFFDRLREDGLLVRLRMSERNPGEVTGYAVALPDRGDSTGRPIWFGGGKLAPDLTVPRLRQRWAGGTGQAGAAGAPRQSSRGEPGRRPTADHRGAGGERTDRFGLTEAERERIWAQATAAARHAAEQIAAHVDRDPAQAADAAWAASDFLAAAARVVEGRRGGPLTTAASAYDAAARELFAGTPPSSTAGTGLRAAGRLLLAARVVKPAETRQLLALLAQLIVLTEAVGRLREAQQRAAQASAARVAVEQLRDLQQQYAPGVRPAHVTPARASRTATATSGGRTAGSR